MEKRYSKSPLGLPVPPICSPCRRAIVGWVRVHMCGFVTQASISCNGGSAVFVLTFLVLKYNRFLIEAVRNRSSYRKVLAGRGRSSIIFTVSPRRRVVPNGRRWSSLTMFSNCAAWHFFSSLGSASGARDGVCGECCGRARAAIEKQRLDFLYSEAGKAAVKAAHNKAEVVVQSGQGDRRRGMAYGWSESGSHARPRFDALLEVYGRR